MKDKSFANLLYRQVKVLFGAEDKYYDEHHLIKCFVYFHTNPLMLSVEYPCCVSFLSLNRVSYSLNEMILMTYILILMIPYCSLYHFMFSSFAKFKTDRFFGNDVGFGVDSSIDILSKGHVSLYLLFIFFFSIRSLIHF
jgi:hypothetical protein